MARGKKNRTDAIDADPPDPTCFAQGFGAASRLARIIEDSLNEIYVIDAATLHFICANFGARKNTGYSAAEMSRLTPLDLNPGLTRAVWDRLTRPLRAGLRNRTRFATRHRRKDGSSYDVSVQLEYMAGEEPAIYVAFIEDLTRRRQTEAKQQTSDAVLASVIATAPDAIVTTDADGIIGSFSTAAEHMFGYDAAEMIGRNVGALMPQPHREAHDGYIRRYRSTGERRMIGIGRRVTAQRKDGSIFPVEVAVGEADQGDVHVFTGFIRDISARVEMEERTNALQRELNHAARLLAMGEMASALAHELNQPLAAVANYAESVKTLLDADDSSDARIGELNAKIAEQAKRAGDIIRRLRRFVRRGEAERRPEDINDIVREAAQFALIGAPLQNVDIVYDLDKTIPPVALDRVQIQQVVVNLVRNALESVQDMNRREVDIETHYNRHDVGRPLQISVRSKPMKRGEVVVSVHDTGPGIADDVFEQVFAPFVTTKRDGMGIGLSVCRSIIETHGGRLWAENGEDGGAMFQFSLPVGREDI